MSAYGKKNVPKKIEGTDFECEDIDEEQEGVHGAEVDPAVDRNKKAPVKKSEADDMDDDSDDDEEDMSKTAKSVLTEANLRKSLRKLQGFVESNDSETRKSVLLKRALDGKELRKSEADELSALLSNRAPAMESASDQLTKSMRENESVQKAIDVSDYLTAQHVELVKALAAVADSVESVKKSQQEFNLMLAKAHVDTGNVVKSMAERFESFSEEPVRGPKSAGVTHAQVRPLNKSFGAPSVDGDELDKAEVLRTLTQMNEESWRLGKGGRTADNEDLSKAVAKFESTRELSKGLRQEVVRRLRG